MDTETSGLSHLYNRIIEVAVLRIEYGVCAERFTSLINPEESVTPWILSLTGIKASELEQAPTFAEIAPRVHETLSGALFIAHNARFDYAFLRQEFKRVGMRFNAKCLCTVRLSRLLDPTAR